MQTHFKKKVSSKTTLARALLIIFLSVFLTINTVYAYNTKIETTARFKLTTPNTYIYFDGTVYADYTYIYSDKLVFSNVYMGSGDAHSTLTIQLENANMTLNKLMEADETTFTLSAPSGTSTTNMTLPSKPTNVKINGVEKDEGFGWTWNGATKTITVTSEHSSDVVVTLLWILYDIDDAIALAAIAFILAIIAITLVVSKKD